MGKKHKKEKSRVNDENSTIINPRKRNDKTFNDQGLNESSIFNAFLDIGKKAHGTGDSRMNRIQSRINLNSEDISNYGFRMGDSICLMSNDSIVLFGIVWPSTATKKGHVAVASMWAYHILEHFESLQKVDVLSLENSDICCIDAQTIHIEPISFTQIKTNPSRQIAEAGESAIVTQYLGQMLMGCIVHQDFMLEASIHGVSRKFRIISIDSATCIDSKKRIGFMVNSKSRVNLSLQCQFSEQNNVSTAINEKVLDSYHNIGGLASQILEIRQVIEPALGSPEIFESFGVPPPKGLLMYGPPGTGKTMIARAVAASVNAKAFVINGPEIISKYVGESEEKLRQIFQDAYDNKPSIVFIDEIDALCPKRDAHVGDMERRIVATLLTAMDGLVPNSQVIVLGATNRPNDIDPALRRPGRLDREIEIGIPNEEARSDILRVQLNKLPHELQLDQIVHLASIAHGFVGADLHSVVKEASLKALKRLSNKSLDLSHFCITFEDMKLSLSEISPSALREVEVNVPHVLWSDIGGQELTKLLLKETVEWPLKHPDAFVRLGIRPPKGVLLYGPPGCSKTLIAKALATESGMNFMAIKGPELLSKWVGESEKAMQSVFRKARAAAPTVVFFDEIDALAVQRGAGDNSCQVADRVLSQLLNELDGIEPLKRVIIVAATNRPDLIDTALMRPGRIDRIIYVCPPDLEARLSILQIHSRKTPLAKDVSLDQIAASTERFTGAELAALVRESALCALDEDKNADCVSQKHFLAALKIVQPQVTDEMLKFYNDFQSKHRM